MSVRIINANRDNSLHTKLYDPSLPTENNSILKKLIGGTLEPEPDPSGRMNSDNSKQQSGRPLHKINSKIVKERRFNLAMRLQ